MKSTSLEVARAGRSLGFRAESAHTVIRLSEPVCHNELEKSDMQADPFGIDAANQRGTD